MLTLFDSFLRDLDQKLPTLNPAQLQRELERVPLEALGWIQIEKPMELPALNEFLPRMPSDKIQTNWTGGAGHSLLKQSTAFVRSVVSYYHCLAQKPLSQGTLLDFGCGWGRLTRLFYKYLPYDSIWAVDPWDSSISICRECHLLGHIELSDDIPRTLPVGDQKFNLIIAFSVFTHLSEKVANIAAATLARHLEDDGILVITIRPREFWRFFLNAKEDGQRQAEQLERAHDACGYAFSPHLRRKVEGEVTYGDASMTLEYVKSHFTDLKIIGIDWTVADQYQLYVYLAKANSGYDEVV